GFNGGVGPGGRCAEAGAVAGLDVRFRLLGADISVPLALGFPLVGDTRLEGRGSYLAPYAPLTTGIRVRF
ncbi:hypothetical protein, partial [Rubrivirga sp.]|uniref:hypothetical protein n=1 Tax=Rubrivirga sp. TaxID=1885344 RepID=UPI003C766C3E